MPADDEEAVSVDHSSEESTRAYHSPLRERRARETRELILVALAELITERGSSEFAVQEVADRAEVSLRTVYRYFPGRQDLLDGLAELIDERMEDLRRDDELGWEDLEEQGLEDLLAAVPAVFARFDELVPLSSAMVLLSAGGRRTSDSHDQRTAVYRSVLSEHLARRDDHEAEQTFAVVRHLLSSATWFALREEFALGGREAGQAAARAVAALLEVPPPR